MSIRLVTPENATPEQAALLARTPPIHLFGLLAHAPALAGRVAALGATVMSSEPDPMLRELIALRVGWRLGAEYVEGQHRRVAAALAMQAAMIDAATGGSEESLSSLCRNALRLADTIAAARPLDDDIAASLEDALGLPGLMSLVVTAGYFVLLACVTRAFALPLEPSPYAGAESGTPREHRTQQQAR